MLSFTAFFTARATLSNTIRSPCDETWTRCELEEWKFNHRLWTLISDARICKRCSVNQTSFHIANHRETSNVLYSGSHICLSLCICCFMPYSCNCFFFKIFKRIIIVQGKLDSYREKVVGGEELNKDQKVCFTHTLMSGDDLTEMVTYIAI